MNKPESVPPDGFVQDLHLQSSIYVVCLVIFSLIETFKDTGINSLWKEAVIFLQEHF